MADFKVTVSVGFANCTQEDVIEIPDEELAECETTQDKEKLLDQYWTDWSNNVIDGSIFPVE